MGNDGYGEQNLLANEHFFNWITIMDRFNCKSENQVVHNVFFFLISSWYNNVSDELQTH